MQTYREREDKFVVPANWPFPPLDEVTPTGGRIEVQQRHLESTYHDTPEADLRRVGVTFRRRSGDEGLGWQVKVPEGTARLELSSASRHKIPPKELVAAVAGVAGGQPLQPIARLVTERTAHRLLDAAGELVAEVADDRVDAASMGEESRLSHWREIEVELGPAGDESVLEAVGAVLRAAGAEPDDDGSTKLDRALGGRLTEAAAPTGEPRLASDLLQGYIREQCGVVIVNDLALRVALDRVHRTRVALRRLRSTMRVFGELIEPEAAARLEPELVWYAGLLGALRDLDIVEHRLEEAVAALPPEQVLGPVSAFIQESLGARRSAARRRLSEAMNSPRYQELLMTLRAWRTSAPLLSGAYAEPAALDDPVRRARRKAEKRLSTAGADPDLLHRARKATKRARYAAELVEPVQKKAAKRAKEAEERQEILGEHQDAMMTAAVLAELGAAAGARADQNGFTFGILLANELHRAAAIRRTVHGAS